MGGAIATLFGYDITLNHNVSSMDMYTFGSPRVGDNAFAASFNTMIHSHYRVTHYRDPVPHVPAMLFGFHHTAREIHESHTDTTVKVCDQSGEDPMCSNQYYIDLDVNDHHKYLGIQSGQCKGLSI